MNEKSCFWLALVAAFVMRLPMLNAGLGLDSDAWRVWLVAARLAKYHQYSASRWPGNPFPEIAIALLQAARLDAPVFVNLISALLSVCGSLFLGLSARALGVRHWVLTAVALACVPIFFEQSVAGMDYVWAVAFAMASLYALCVRRPGLAGSLLGLAVGCRITSGALAIGYAILLLERSPAGTRAANLVRFAVTMSAVSLALFSPVFARYGWPFLSHGDDPYPTWTRILHSATAAVWGEVGTASILIVVLRAVFGRRATEGKKRAVNWQLVAWLSAIVLYYTAFLLLPSEPAYLVITIPFVLLALSQIARSPREYAICCIAIAAAPFLPHIKQHTIVWKPRIVENYFDRLQNEADLDTTIAISKTLPGPLVIACNDAWPRLAVHLWRSGDVTGEVYEEYVPDHEADRFVWTLGRDGKQVRFANHIRPSAVRGYLENGFKLYFMNNSVQSEVGWPNPVSGGRYDLIDFGAEALPVP